jgi:hypothetical protein
LGGTVLRGFPLGARRVAVGACAAETVWLVGSGKHWGQITALPARGAAPPAREGEH